MKRKYKRLTFVTIGGLLIASAVGLMVSAFEDNIIFFRAPGDIISGTVNDHQRIRLGGLVADGSIEHGSNGLVRFVVTDTMDSVPVEYVGILPDLFREGQGVVTEGMMINGVFKADEVLAKHDETYMPPEVSEALKKAGQWRDNGNSGE